jgi:hypothetical protein
VLAEAWHNTSASEIAEGNRYVAAAVGAARLAAVDNPTIQQQLAAQAAARAAQSIIRDDTSQWYELQLRAVDKAGLEATYELTVSVLSIPRMIDLEDAAGPLVGGGSGPPPSPPPSGPLPSAPPIGAVNDPGP